MNQQFAKHPDHPGVAHYLIHANDFPGIADSGLAAATCYAKIAPAAPHALHMPSHIFTRVGLWRESAETNQRSVDAARQANEITEQLHAYDYMIYADLQLARDRDAEHVVQSVRSLAAQNRTANDARAAIPPASQSNAATGGRQRNCRSRRKQISLYCRIPHLCPRARRGAQRRS